MSPFERPDRCCPGCRHPGYLFRARRTVEGTGEDAGRAFVATKYRCRACAHEWWEQVPAPPERPPAGTGDAR